MVKIPVSQILYIEKSKNYLEYHTGDQVYRIRGTIADVEEAFRKEGFSKCISGCLVNLKYVTKASKDTVWLSFHIQMSQAFEEEVSQMCNLSEGVEQKGIQKGMQRALTESIKNLMDTMNMTAKEAMDALKIKEEDRSQYTELLKIQK